MFRENQFSLNLYLIYLKKNNDKQKVVLSRNIKLLTQAFVWI